MIRVFSIACALFAACSSPVPEQPLLFNHALHAGENKIPCETCHRGARASERAGLPAMTTCLSCHMKPLGSPPSAREARVREVAAAEAVVEWVQVTRNPGHVYFSHRAHVALGGMSCGECHGAVERWSAPPTQPTGALVDMDACMACHRRSGASNECGTCHR